MIEIGWLQIILLLAAGQSILLAFGLYQKYRHLLANRFLMALLLGYTFIFLHLVANDLGYLTDNAYIISLMLLVPFASNTLHFLYTRYLIRPSDHFSRRDYIHFLPILLLGLLTLCVYGLNLPAPVELSLGASNRSGFPRFVVINWLMILHAYLYLGQTMRLLGRYDREIRSNFSTIEQIQLNWLKLISWFILSAWSIFFLENLLLLADFSLSGFALPTFMMAVYIYIIGYMAWFKSEIFQKGDTTVSLQQLPMNQPNSGEEESVPVASAIAEKYQKSGLTREKMEEYARQLLDYMNKHKPYREATLNLNQLALQVNMRPYHLSEVLNVHFQKNFYDFVNQFRVEEVKNNLIDPRVKNLTILAIAFEAGFNSKAGFNTIFKKLCGMTPSQYRENH